jgi:cysteinyl-tRNA synthetase
MLHIYNTLSKKVEEFQPLTKGSVSMYSCGPTVYNLPHIGNYRAFLFNDILKRTLLFLGFEVNHIMNITDVDDKTIRDSQKAGKTLAEFTQFYTKEFNIELEHLNILPASKQILATNHIKEMVEMIELLKAKGFAYTGEDGSTYFAISKFTDYGALSGVNLTDQNNQLSRIVADEYDKDNPQDFALWKAWTPEDGENFWDSSLGKGRPGWHIECSAMATKYLGNHFDIHTGGIDLTFPHHENEIAQSVCAHGEPFVNYWLHNEHILINGEKMSKSKGNQFTLSDIIQKGYHPLDFRYFVLGAHYRTKVNLTWESLDAARNARIKLTRFVEDIESSGDVNERYNKLFSEALTHDLNTSEALAVMWELVKDGGLSKEDKKATLVHFDTVLGLGLGTLSKPELPDEVESLIRERDKARSEKDFETSDNLRAKLESLGYDVLDTPEGTKVYKN